MTDEEAIRASGRARVELEQTEAAFERVRASLIEEWANTGPGNEAKLQKLHMGVQLLAAVKKALLETVASGDVARARDALAEQGIFRP